MRRTILVLPKIVAFPEAATVLGHGLPNLERLVSHSELVRLEEIPRSPTPEAAFLGLDPREVAVAQGPLLAAAHRVDPPPGGVCFALSVLSSDADGRVVRPPSGTATADLTAVWEAVKRLETPAFRMFPGTGFEHVAVWIDGSIELMTVPAGRLEQVKLSLPEGDGEGMLRRFIDDSVNLLSPLDVNSRRADEGLPALNLVWPWGQGLMAALPNLALARGEPAWVESGSWRLKGLCRLVGYGHGDPESVTPGINLRLEPLLAAARKYPLCTLVLDTPGRLREEGRIEEALWLSKRIDDELLRPLMDDAALDRNRILVVAPGFAPPPGISPLGSPEGLGALFDSNAVVSNVIPFDERALEERLPRRTPWNWIEEGMAWSV